MPRPASAIWAHFRKDVTNKRAVCKYCDHNMCGLATRMRAHLVHKCLRCPLLVKDDLSEADMSRKTGQIVPSSGAGNSGSSASGTAVPTLNDGSSNGGNGDKKQRRTRLSTPSLSSTSSLPSGAATALDDKSDLDSYVAKAVFGAALPVSTVENAAFVKMLKRLNPGYEPPSAFALATTLLDLEYTEAQLKLRAEMLDATAICMGVESWSTLTNRSVVSCTIHTPSPGVFAFEATGELPHSADVLADKVESLMAQVGTAKIVVVVMDTSPAMAQAGELLSAKYPDITFLPSCAYAMARMMHEMLALPSIAATLATCTQLIQFVATHHTVRASFTRVAEQMQMQALEAPYPLAEPDDDDASNPIARLECLFSVERNHHVFELLVAENNTLSELDAAVKDQILSLSFWNELATCTALLEPFLDMLKTFEADYPLLSTFYHRFTLLWGHLEKFGTLATKLQQVMSSHWQTLRHPAMYTAYLLDPRFSTSNLSADATNEVVTYLKRSGDANAFATLVSELTRFTGRVGMFADDAIWESAQKCSPIHWWKGFIGSSCPNLQAVALRTLCFPATSGLPKAKRDMFDKILSMNAKVMNEEQASKAALVYLNANLSTPGVEDGVANETIV